MVASAPPQMAVHPRRQVMTATNGGETRAELVTRTIRETLAGAKS